MNMHVLGLEAIDFQTSHPLGKALDIAVTSVRSLQKVTTRNLSNTKLASIVQSITGLNLDFEVDPDTFAATMVPDVDKNNPLIGDWAKRYMKSASSNSLLAKKDVIKGGVDLEKARVTGDFTEFKGTIYLGDSLLNKSSPFTVSEVVAIILHEIGHNFVYLEMLGRMVSTNYVLSEAANRLLGTVDKQRKFEIMYEIEEGAGIDITDKEALLPMSNKAGITTVLINDAIFKSRSELGVNIYDARGFEKLSDQFATRMGYGKDLATGLDKLYRLIGYGPAYRGRVMNIFIQVIKVLLFLVAGILNPFIAILILCSNPLDDVYDKPKKRIEGIRNELSAALKAKNLSKRQKLSILEEIDVMDGVTADMTEYLGVYEWIWGAIYPGGRKQRTTIEIQQSLERLSNTRLSESLTRLELLA